MSEPTSAAVECPICGEEFDPSAAGGWCTNPDCGEWQYLGEEVPEPVESDDATTEDESSDEAAEPEGGDESASPAEADEDETATVEETDSPEPTEGEEEEVSEPVAEEADDAWAEEPDAEPPEAPESTGAETDDVAPEGDDVAAASDDVATDTDESTAAAVSEEDTAAEAEDKEAVDATCPDCGAAVDEDDNFCADCGADLTGEEPTLEECPDCGAEVADDDSFCANCGQDLEAAREALTDAGESAPVGDDAVGEAAADESAAPESLVLSARGEEIAVTDDETVGREVRRILTESGADEEDAVRIHREHVRFVREGGQFYLVDLGDNPTALNDRRLTKGDREPVEPGDEIELSGVVTLSVEAP